MAMRIGKSHLLGLLSMMRDWFPCRLFGNYLWWVFHIGIVCLFFCIYELVDIALMTTSSNWRKDMVPDFTAF